MYIPAEDADAVRKIKLAGAVILGKTNTHEFALGVTGVNPHYGAVKNPWDLSRITGGSSSGSAAAVASGMCLAALGTDTGGSIRIPASLCGVVGIETHLRAGEYAWGDSALVEFGPCRHPFAHGPGFGDIATSPGWI